MALQRVRMRLGFYEFSTTSNAMIKFFKRLSCKIVNLSSFDFCNENFSSFYGNYSNHINTVIVFKRSEQKNSEKRNKTPCFRQCYR